MDKNNLEKKISAFYEEFLLRKPDKTGLYYFVSMIEAIISLVVDFPLVPVTATTRKGESDL